MYTKRIFQHLKILSTSCAPAHCSPQNCCRDILRNHGGAIHGGQSIRDCVINVSYLTESESPMATRSCTCRMNPLSSHLKCAGEFPNQLEDGTSTQALSSCESEKSSSSYLYNITLIFLCFEDVNVSFRLMS